MNLCVWWNRRFRPNPKSTHGTFSKYQIKIKIRRRKQIPQKAKCKNIHAVSSKRSIIFNTNETYDINNNNKWAWNVIKSMNPPNKCNCPQWMLHKCTHGWNSRFWSEWIDWTFDSESMCCIDDTKYAVIKSHTCARARSHIHLNLYNSVNK